MFRIGIIVALSCTASLATVAKAVPIEFIQTGSGSGTLDGIPFANSAFIIKSFGDTDNRVLFGSAFSINNGQSTFDIDGLGSLTLITGTRTFLDPNNGLVGYSLIDNEGPDLFDGPTNAALESWAMLDSIGLVTGTGRLLQWSQSETGVSVQTDRGALFFNNGTPAATFQAVLLPEPSTLILAALGGLALAAMRGRK
ncbi:MAG TPA: PEP-CTERM sorting domain-containing protein [Pirellulales bacterium]|jgi:hypothetical protein